MALKLSRASFAAAPKSRLELERLAEEYLRKMYPDNLTVPRPLDVLGMMDGLEDHFGIVFGVEELPPGEEGYTNPLTSEIIIDEHVYDGVERGDGRARLTCCHEVGHVQHVSQVRRVIRDGGPQLTRRFNVTVPIYRDPEWQAYAVGSALLMPLPTVPLIYARGGVNAVADFFQVSRQAAEVRISVLAGLGVL